MVQDVRIGKELIVAVEDKAGVLAGISSLIADHGISITAITASGIEGKAIIRMLTDDNLRSSDALKAKGYDLTEEEVVREDSFEIKALASFACSCISAWSALRVTVPLPEVIYAVLFALPNPPRMSRGPVERVMLRLPSLLM